MTDSYDLVVIGAGSGGLVGARFAAQLGAKVALVEKNRIGGDCTWTGCVPSKALLKAAKLAHDIRTAIRYGIQAGASTIDMSGVRAYIRSAMESVYQFETPETLSHEGIDVILGAARFLSDSEIAADDRVIRSKAFLLTTGARPVVPRIADLQDVPFITYEQIFDNEVLARSMIVIGGGPIGIEIAQAYQRLGSLVTVVTDSVLPKDEPDARQLTQTILEREGVCFILEPAMSARRDGNAVVIMTENHEITGDLLLIAVGRKPNIDGLDLEKAGVKYSPVGIFVDDRLRTNVHHIYAAGDVTGSYQFTHYAGWQAFLAVRNALLPGSSSGVSDLVPWVTFTDPEIAHVGLTEAQARAKHGDGIRVHRWDLGKVDRAVCENDSAGFFKIVSRRDGKILGATIVAARAGEAIVELIVAMKHGIKIDDLAGTIHPYPTYSTAIQQIAAEMTVEHLLSGTSGKVVRRLSRAVR
ncbi:MAG TPA: FAD-dependent oxidoreductase [Terriglobales bacterium]|nr:FAD-dependent oxidoreductase [Terriglobales bacterium]